MKKNAQNPRPPIVTLMGHVDHGKTTLLDVIRKTNIVQSEHGGITQHIGAYQITHDGKPITFIDTPGHAAFEKMRFRGALIADIIILVVAATEGVKKQTEEAIKYIKSAGKPTIVAITKVDLEGSLPEKVKKGLQAKDIVVESYGGDVPTVEVSAPKNKGISELLEVIQLIWQLSPEPSLPNDPLEAVVVESFLDKSRGPVATVIIKKGTLKVGQKIIVDEDTITVRALVNDIGNSIKEAKPGDPVEILGFKKVLDVGSTVSEKLNTKNLISSPPASIADIIAKAEEAKGRFKVVIKADVLGSLEAVLQNIDEKILVIASGVGDISPNDVAFAKAGQAPILAFNVKTSNSDRQLAEREGVIIKNYNVIYELIADMEEVAGGFQQAKDEQKITGRGKIIASFEIDGIKVAGVKVTQGKLKKGDKVFLKRDNVAKGESEISSIKKFKKDFESVSQGQECGIAFSSNIDFAVGDSIESLGSN